MFHITQDILEEIKDVEAGTTVAIDHKDCPAGEDTRGRLYITRPPIGDHVLCYCHNCQEGTTYKSPHEGYRPTPTGAVEDTTSDFKIPLLVTSYDEWPKEMKKRFIKYGLGTRWTQGAKIAYSPHHHAIYQPVYANLLFWEGSDTSISGDLIGYQLRGLSGAGPKYTTVIKDKSKPLYSNLIGVGEGPRSFVIVEDLLSGLRLLQGAAAHYERPVTAFVNYGVQINPTTLTKIGPIKKDDEIHVWLDNDNDHVREQAKKMARTVGLIFGRPVNIVEVQQDPKASSYITIAKELEWTQ